MRIPERARRIDARPRGLWGGQRQRAMIATALANDPDPLIADEPTAGLDLTIRAEFLALLGELPARLGLSVLFTASDFGIVEACADRVDVKRQGRVVEEGPPRAVFEPPREAHARIPLAAAPERSKPPVLSVNQPRPRRGARAVRRCAVMKDGRIVEEGPVKRVFAAPRTDRTRALMTAAFDLPSVLRARREAGAGGRPA